MSNPNTRSHSNTRQNSSKKYVYRDKIIERLKRENITFSALEPEILIKAAEELGKEIKNEDLKNHQLRRLFGAIKGIEYEAKRQKAEDILKKDIVAQLVFLKIHLANAQQKLKNIKELKRIMDVILSSKFFVTKKDLDYFVRFFEAILAYHE